MEFNEVIRKRTAVRKYSDRKVEEEKIQSILEAGNLAPTAKNLQPQRIFVVRSEEYLKKIDEITPCRFNAPLVFVICSNKDEAFAKEGHSSYEMDACIVITHMMLEATELGLGSIWLERFDAAKVRELFDLPENIVPVTIMPVGYTAEDYAGNPNHTKRKNLEDIVKYY